MRYGRDRERAARNTRIRVPDRTQDDCGRPRPGLIAGRPPSCKKWTEIPQLAQKGQPEKKRNNMKTLGISISLDHLQCMMCGYVTRLVVCPHVTTLSFQRYIRKHILLQQPRFIHNHGKYQVLCSKEEKKSFLCPISCILLMHEAIPSHHQSLQGRRNRAQIGCLATIFRVNSP